MCIEFCGRKNVAVALALALGIDAVKFPTKRRRCRGYGPQGDPSSEVKR